MNARLLILLLLSVMSAAAAEPQEITHRITGLCCREREAEFRQAMQDKPEVKLISLDYSKAEATFAYDPKTFSADQVRQLLSARGFGFKTTPPIPADQLTRIEIAIIGLDCIGCSLAAYNIVMKVEGVEQATASFKEGRVIAMIDASKTDKAALEEALKKARVEIKPP